MNGAAGFLAGEDLKKALEYRPSYDEGIHGADLETRILSLQDIYEIYIPTVMTVEIYNKLYFALQSALRKKLGADAVRQRNANYRMALGGHHCGILGGADSMTIIGHSGIGKSAAIGKVKMLLNSIPFEGGQMVQGIIPCLEVQCPFDASPKALLLEILRTIDSILGSTYHAGAIRARATQDMLIGAVSQACLNHVGLLIIDEIQGVVGNKNGHNLVGMLTQLINTASGISLCMVGTPESSAFFEGSAIHLSRRTIGLQYGPMEFGDEFTRCCENLWKYQYVKHYAELTPGMLEWLYEHTNGIMALLITLFHDVQEMAMLDATERITLQGLNQVYRTRMGMVQPYLNMQKNVARSGKPRRQISNHRETGGGEAKGTTGDDQPSAQNNAAADITEVQIQIDDNMASKGNNLAGLAEQAQSEGVDLTGLLLEKGLLAVAEVSG